MEITFLGTSAMVPTKERNLSSFILIYKGEGILFDCGEGTQRQLKITGIKPTKVTKIMISHWHGDHVLGLPGLIQTLGSAEYNDTLEIYGPEGTKQFIDMMFKASIFDNKIKIKVAEIKKDGVFLQNKDYSIEAFKLDHKVPTIGFNFLEKDRRRIRVNKVKKIGIPDGPLLGKLQKGQEITFKNKKITPEEVTNLIEGKKISFIADTVPCKNCIKYAKEADLLICESTYSSELEDKGTDYMHLTAKQAATIANESGAKKLVLTHFSARYKSQHELEEDAREIFDNVNSATDFMKMRL